MTTQETPFDATIWMNGLPEKELYGIYAETLSSRFPAFGIRDFSDCRFDLSQPLHPYDDSVELSQVILDVIVTPESHERFANALNDHIKIHKLKEWQEAGGSVVFATDHGQFTDVPVTAETLGKIGFGDRRNTIQVVSKMISLMALDLGNGSFDVIRTLSNISAVAQTVPRLDGNPSLALEEYREKENSNGLVVMKAARDTEGSTTVLSVIGRHNQKSKNGNTLYIHEPNRRSLEAYMAHHVKVVPICIDCPTFRSDGSIVPADMQFELFSPLLITDPRNDTKQITALFRDATNRIVGKNFKHGVRVRTWNAQQALSRAKALSQRVRHDDNLKADY